MNRATKEQFVEEMYDKLGRSQIVVLLDFNGLSVAETNELRRKFDAEDAEFRVVKNTLVGHAIERAGLEALVGFLEGPTSVLLAYGDPIASMKALADYIKGNSKLQVKAAYFGGQILDLEGVNQLATMPSREEMLGRLLATMQAPMQQLVGVLSAVPRNVVNVLNAYKDQKSQEAQA